MTAGKRPLAFAGRTISSGTRSTDPSDLRSLAMLTASTTRPSELVSRVRVFGSSGTFGRSNCLRNAAFTSAAGGYSPSARATATWAEQASATQQRGRTRSKRRAEFMAGLPRKPHVTAAATRSTGGRLGDPPRSISPRRVQQSRARGRHADGELAAPPAESLSADGVFPCSRRVGEDDFARRVGHADGRQRGAPTGRETPADDFGEGRANLFDHAAVIDEGGQLGSGCEQGLHILVGRRRFLAAERFVDRRCPRA